MRRTLSQGGSRPTARRVRRASGPSTLAGALGVAAALALACGATPDRDDARTAPTDFAWPDGPHPTVTLHVEGRGDITIELYPELAPRTVANFVELARNGFYDGTTFHRVIPDFMIQGGDPNTRDRDPRNDGQGGPGYTIPDEPNPAPHVRGAISMANTGRPDSGGSQFFIVQQDAPHLDGEHTVFGRVVAGIEVVDAIAAVEVDEHGRWGAANRPIENVVISGITVREASDTAHVDPAPGSKPAG